MASCKLGRPVDILLAEDSPDDVALIKEALKDSQIKLAIHVAKDGQEAIDYLHVADANHTKPDLVILDLNMPRKSGLEVLQEIKCDQSLKRIPVIVLTTSQSDQDIIESYNLHANCYITKPSDFDDFVDMVRIINEFWLSLVKLPVA